MNKLYNLERWALRVIATDTAVLMGLLVWLGGTQMLYGVKASSALLNVWFPLFAVTSLFGMLCCIIGVVWCLAKDVLVSVTNKGYQNDDA